MNPTPLRIPSSPRPRTSPLLGRLRPIPSGVRATPRSSPLAQIDFMLARMYSPEQIAVEMNARHFSGELAELAGVPVGFISTHFHDGVLKLSKLYLESAWHGPRLRPGAAFTRCRARQRTRRAGRFSCSSTATTTRPSAPTCAPASRSLRTLDQPFGAFVLNDYRMKRAVPAPSMRD